MTQRTTIRITRWRWGVWALWGLAILSYAALFVFTIPFAYQFHVSDGAELFSEVFPRLNLTPHTYAVYYIALNVIYFTASVSVALVLFWKRGLDPMALLASLMLLAAHSHTGRGVYELIAHSPEWIPWIIASRTLSGTLICTFLFTFPNGRFVPTWTRWLIPVILLANLGINILHFARGVANIVLIGVMLQAVIGTGFQVYRYRRASTPAQRQQTKWVLYGWFVLAFALLCFVAMDIPITPWLREQPFIRLIYRLVVNLVLIYLPATAIPVTFAVALLRYRLWDVDFVINRSLVYGALTLVLAAVLGAGFLGLRALLDLIVQGDHSNLALVGATALVVGLFEPARVRLRRFVDKRFYGIELDYRKALKEYASRARAVRQAPGDITTFGEYTGLRLLGKGGMSEVYRAQHPKLNRAVAIKLIPERMTANEEITRRFLREAQTIGGLKHPNIITLYDFGEQNNIPFMVMEYIQGQDLSEILDERGRLPLPEAVLLLEDIVSALDYAHAQGVVHRDIKPSNIMVEPITASGEKRTHRAVLMDFGIAKLHSALTQLTQDSFVGTLDYISPEQIQGAAEVDARADIYSLGVMTYQLLTGQVPFKHNNPGATIVAHLMQPAPDPSDVVPNLATRAGIAVRRAMAKRPEQRFATAGEFLQALNAA